MMIYSLLFVTMLVIVGGCGTELDPHSGTSNLYDDEENFNEDDYKKIITANHKLGFKMLKEVRENEEENIFISPLSLFMALSMIYHGADGATKEEIAATLETEGIDEEELNQANASLLAMLDENSDDIQLNLANSIWLNNKFHFQDEFATLNRDYFNAEIQEIDVLENESSKLINDWVDKSTNGKITDIVGDSLNPNLATILINAIYFKGNWLYEFDDKLTEAGTFYVNDEVTEDAEFMHLNEELTYMEDDELQAVVLPYGEGEMSMTVFLPKEESNLIELEEKLASEDWSSLRKNFEEREGTVVFPKFKLEYEMTLNEVLENMGMGLAFDSEKADFSKMIVEDNPIWISQVKQKTFIDVNETGTEASGATSIEMDTTSAPINIDEPFYMEVDRPFFIMITDDETNTILFMGSIYHP